MSLFHNNCLMTSSQSTAGDDAYQIEKSLRFNDNDSAYLRRDPVKGNQRTYTFSGWLKLGHIGGNRNIFTVSASPGNSSAVVRTEFCFGSDYKIKFGVNSDGSSWKTVQTVGLFRDPSAWYHVVCAVDTTQSIETERVKIYVNGKKQTLENNYPVQNEATPYNSANAHGLGVYINNLNDYWDGLMSNVEWIDGLQLSPAAFGEFSSDGSGVWNPKAFALPAPNTGVTWTPSSGGPTNAANMFDGSLSTSTSLNNSDGTKTVTTQSFTIKNSLRVYISPGSGYYFDWTINGIKYRTDGTGTTGWYTVDVPPNTEVTSFTVSMGPSSGDSIRGLEIDGQILVDGKTDLSESVTNGAALLNYPGNTVPLADSIPGKTRGDASGITAVESAGTNSFGLGNVAIYDAAGDNVPVNNIPNIFGSPWTIDTYMKLDSLPSAVSYWTGFDSDNGTAVYCIGLASDNKWAFWQTSGDDNIYHTTTAVADTWYHIRVTRDSNSKLNMWVNGTKGGEESCATVGSGAGDFRIGNYYATYNSGLSSFRGNIGPTRLVAADLGAPPSGGLSTTSGVLPSFPDGLPGNSFHLKFNDTSLNRYLGKDTLNGKIADATGGLPIYNTTGGYGDVKGSGYRADSSAGTTDGAGLVFALPGDVLTDVHHNINTGSSQVAVSNNNNVSVSTADSRFYGSSLWFPNGGSGDYLKTTSSNSDFTFGTGNFTIEFWAKNTGNANGGLFQFTDQEGLETDYIIAMVWSNSNQIETYVYKAAGGFNGFYGTSQDVKLNRWTHIAFQRTGSTTYKLYIDGVLKNTFTATANETLSPTYLNIGAYYNNTKEYEGYIQDFRVYRVAKYSNNFKPATRNDFQTVVNLNAAGITGHAGPWNTGFKKDSRTTWGSATDWTPSSGDTVTTNGNNTVLYIDRQSLGDAFSITIEDTGGTNDIYVAEADDGSSWSETYNNQNKLILTESSSTYISTSGTTTDVTSSIKRYLRLEGAGGGHCTMTITGTAFAEPATQTDSFTDTPTNYEPGGGDTGVGGEVRGNFCTWNPQNMGGTSNGLAQGNLKASSSTNSRFSGTMVYPSGKWYWEYTIHGDALQQIGIIDIEKSGDDFSAPGGSNHNGYIYLTGFGGSNDARLYNNGTASITNWPNGTTGDVVMIAYDSETGKLWFGENGTWFNDSSGNTGNPATGANPAITVTSTLKDQMTPVCGSGGGSDATNGTANFGQRAFKYTAPSGFKCLCTQNFPDTFSGDELNNPSSYFDIVLYKGNGTSQDIKGVDFGPDFIWVKERDSTSSHQISDQTRGTGKRVAPDQNMAEYSNAGMVTAFNSDGFSVGSQGGHNEDGKTYVGWLWDAGTAANTSGLTDGSIDISSGNQWVNSTAGFSITKYTGNGTAAADFSHGLAVPPELIIIKNLDQNDGWSVAHKGAETTGDNVGGGSVPEWYMLYLNESNSAANWSGDTCAPSGNTKIALGDGHQVNANNENYICYAWAPISGYSAFGAYEASGSSGKFLYLGFKPALIIFKAVDAAGSWNIRDNKRDKINPNEAHLIAEGNAAETTQEDIDFVSNGVVIRSTDAGYNNSNTFVYMAWAEHPFKTARAM